MGIEVSKLTGQLKNIAEMADKSVTENGVLEGQEIEIFRMTAEAKLKSSEIGETEKVDYTQEDLNKILGLEKQETAVVTSPVETTKKVPKAYRKNFENSVEGLAKKTNSPDQLMNAIRARYIGQAGTPAEYRQLLADATEIYSAVKATNYQTKEDVEKIHTTVKKQLKASKKYTGINKEVLKAFEKAAEKEVINREFKVLADDFDNRVLTNAKYSNDYKACLEDMKKELKDSKKWKESYTKEAFEMLEDYAEKKSTNSKVAAAKSEITGTEAPIADESYGWTKDGKRAKYLVEHKKEVNERIEEMKTLTKEEIQKGLGKKLTAKLAVYINDHTDPATGKVDLSGLVTDEKEGIRHHVGADDIMNRNYDDSQLDEKHWTTYGLRKLTGSDITEKEAVEIAEFAKIPEQKKSHNLVRAAKESLVPAIAGAIAGATFGVYADQSVKINVSAEMASSIMNQLGSAATKTMSADGTNASIEIRQIADLRLLAALGGFGEGLALGILLKVITGMKDNEKTCFSSLKSSQYHTLAELEHFAKTEYPDKADAIMTMAKLPRFMNEDGSWNSQKFYDFINGPVAGQGSVVNHDECTMADTVLKPEPKVEKKPDGEKFKEDDTKVNTTHVDKEVTTLPNARHYKWENVTKIYSCFDGMPQLQATRAMEVIQAIDPDKLNVRGQYNIDRITDIVAKAFDKNFMPNKKYIREQLEAEYPEVSKETLLNVLGAGYLGTAITKDNKENKLVTPDELYDTNGNVQCIRDLSKLKRPNEYGKGPGKNNVGVKTGYGEDTHTSTTTTHYYIRENGKVREVNKAEYDASPYKVGKRNK